MTKATYKSFIRKNDNLYFKSLSDFDGMVDCVMPTKSEWKKIEDKNDLLNGQKIGWLVNGGRNYFTPIENGIEVSNCCGSFQIVNKTF